MKKYLTMLLIGSFVWIANAAWAETVIYPKAAPIFSLDFPKRWGVTETARFLKAKASDQNHFIYAVLIKDATDLKSGADAVTTGKAFAAIIKDAKFGEALPDKEKDMNTLILRGTAVGKEKSIRGRHFDVSVTVISPDSKTICALATLIPSEAKDDHKKGLQEEMKPILSSIVNATQK